ncbi:MAG: amidohydrolase family protein [Anaerolineales bacterium]|nr:amidohydrolase family protein [Anaerolineales bacterium]
MSKKVDTILKNALVLTMDDDFSQYEHGAVAVVDDKIVAVGNQEEITSTYTADNEIDCEGKVLMPGLVNAHTHVPMTLLRGLADDLRLDVWLLGYMMPVEREFVSPEFVYLGTQIACAEFIRSGVTCFADMYYFEEEVAKATADAGLRALCTESILKFPTPDASSYEDGLAYTRDYIKRWKGHPLIVPGVAPHAPYTCTPEILQQSAALAVEFDVPLHTHLAETTKEVEDMRAANDMPVIPYVKKQNLFNAKVLAAHCVHVDHGEIHTLLHHGAGVAHNPTSNMKLSSGAAPTTDMIAEGINVGIGTDGPASNNDLDMFEEIRLAALLAKLSTNDPTSLPAKTVLNMATHLGAKALHMGDITGSLESGKRADLITVDVKPLHNSPQFRRDPDGVYAQIIYAAKSTDVNDVMVNGKWLMRDHVLLTLDEAALLREASAYADKIDAFLNKREESVYSKLIAIGGATEAESFEVQVKVKIDNAGEFIQAFLDSGLEVIYHKHYRQYDTYFQFDDPKQGQLRIREDDLLNKKKEIIDVRYRLTLLGESQAESLPHQLPDGVFLSRSRFLAPSTHTLRFYREYFKPEDELFIQKDRMRWLVRYKDNEFFVNIDEVEKPDLGAFIEIKSRTWSRRDAEHKATLSYELLELLGATPDQSLMADYATLTAEKA